MSFSFGPAPAASSFSFGASTSQPSGMSTASCIARFALFTLPSNVRSLQLRHHDIHGDGGTSLRRGHVGGPSIWRHHSRRARAGVWRIRGRARRGIEARSALLRRVWFHRDVDCGAGLRESWRRLRAAVRRRWGGCSWRPRGREHLWRRVWGDEHSGLRCRHGRRDVCQLAE